MIDVGTLRSTFQIYDQVTPVLQKMDEQMEESEKHTDSLGNKVSSGLAAAFEALVARLEDAGAHFRHLGEAMVGAAVAAPIMGSAFATTATELNQVTSNAAALIDNMEGGKDALLATSAEMKAGIRAIAIETGKSTTDIGTGLYEVISALGYTKDSMKQLELAAKAGIAGGASTIDAFKLLVNVTMAYGDTSAEAFQKVADLSFQAVNMGRTTYPELSASMGTVLPIAREMGVSLKELFAIITATAGTTGDTAKVMTELASALAGLETPGDDLLKIFKQMGVESGKEAIAEYGFAGALQQVAHYAGLNEEAIIKLLGRKEAWIITSALAGAQAQNLTTQMGNMNVAVGSLERTFERQKEGVNSVGFSWSVLQVHLKNVAEKIGDLLLPVYGKLIAVMEWGVGVADRVVTALGQIPKVVAFVAMGIVSASVAMGVLSWSFGSAITLITMLIAFLVKLGVSTLLIGGLRFALTSLGTAIGGIVGDSLIAAAAAKTWSLALAGLQTAFTAFMGSTLGWATIAGVMFYAVSSIVVKLKEVGDQSRGTDDRIQQAARNIGIFSGAWTLLGDAMNWFTREPAAQTKKAVEAVGSVVDGVGAQIGVWFQNVGGGATKAAGTAVSYVSDMFYILGRRMYGANEEEEKLAKTQKDHIKVLNGLHTAIKDALDAQRDIPKYTDASIRSAIGETESLSLQKKATEVLGKPVKDLQTAMRVLAISTGMAADQQERQADLVEKITGKKKFEALAKALTDIAHKEDEASWDKWEKGLDETDKSIIEFAKHLDDTAWDKWEDGLKKDSEALNELAAAADKVDLERFKKAVETLGPTDAELHKQMDALRTVVSELGGAFFLSDQQLTNYIKALQDLKTKTPLTTTEARELADALAIQANKAGVIKGAVDDMGGAWQKFKNMNIKDLLEGVAYALDALTGGASDVSAAVQNIGHAFEQVQKAVDDANLDGVVTDEEQATINAQKFHAAMVGIAEVGKILSKSTTPAIAKLGDAMQTAAGFAMIGKSLFGAWGAAIGGALGFLTGFFMHNQKVIMQINDERDAFIEAHGGWLALQKSIKKATDEDLLKKLFDAKTPEAYKKAIDDINDALNNLDEANQALDDAMERYGITIDQLGPKFAQQKLDQQAAQLIKDWDILIAAGVDMNTLVEKMGPDINKLVDTYAKAGVDIPSSLKPIIDELWKQGKLVHEDGTAYTEAEYKALTYGKTLTEAMEEAVKAIEKLVAALLHIPNVDTTVTVHHKDQYDGGGDGDGDGNGHGKKSESYASGSMGFKDFGRGTQVRLHGVERVQTAAQARNELAGSDATTQEIRGLRRDLADLPEILRRSFRDAMAMSGGRR